MPNGQFLYIEIMLVFMCSCQNNFSKPSVPVKSVFLANSLTIQSIFLLVLLDLVLGEAALEVDVEVVAAFLPLSHVSVLHGCGGSGELRPARGSGDGEGGG